jgi:hypothetical protein
MNRYKIGLPHGQEQAVKPTGRDELMREPKEPPQAEASAALTQGAQSEPQAWNPPTLTTWEIKEETLSAKTGSGPDPP